MAPGSLWGDGIVLCLDCGGGSSMNIRVYRTVHQEKRSVVFYVNFLKNTFFMAKSIIRKFKRQMTELEKVFI